MKEAFADPGVKEILEVIYQLLYLLLGVAVGFGIAFVQNLRTRRDALPMFPAYAGGFGSSLSYAFSTSIWVRFANEHRTLGMPTDDVNTRLLLVLGDHRFLCAVLVSICFYFAAFTVQQLRKRTRQSI